MDWHDIFNGGLCHVLVFDPCCKPYGEKKDGESYQVTVNEVTKVGQRYQKPHDVLRPEKMRHRCEKKTNKSVQLECCSSENSTQ